MDQNQGIVKKMNMPPRKIIHPKIYIFIYNLIKYIIFDEDKPQKLENNIKEKRLKKIHDFIGITNEIINYSKKEKEKITAIELTGLTTDFSKKNFENIILFLKQQNQIYVGDILDIILTQICGFAITGPYETINEHIFDNLKNLKNIEDCCLDRVRKSINVEVFKDEKIKQNLYPPFGKMVICPFLYLLFYSYAEKFEIIKGSKKYNDYDTMKYIFNYYIDGLNNYFIDDLGKTINSSLSGILERKQSSSFFNIHYLSKSLLLEFDIINKLLGPHNNDDPLPTSKSPIDLLQYFFFTIFIYNKMITNNLIKYSQSDNNEINKIINIPFTYNMETGNINIYYALMVSSPIKAIKSIKNVLFRQNNIGDVGLFEIGKACLFNKNIEYLNYNNNFLRGYYFAYLTSTQRIFENYNVKQISISNNIYMKEDIDILLCEIIKHFKGLKIISISNNELKSGIKNFCIELKKLYRLNKCEIEELNFNNCMLDDGSIYELSELLKCKKCRLKSLNLNYNNLKDAYKIFKCIKKNKSLVKLYVSQCQINNNMINEINKMISLNLKLEKIDLSNNCIKSSDQLIRLVSRTKEIRNLHEKNKDHSFDKKRIIINHVHLFFLNISQNPIDYLQYKFIDKIKDIVSLSNLRILDLSKIILGEDPVLYEEKEKTKNQKHYYEYVKSYSKFFNGSDKNINGSNTKKNEIEKSLIEVGIFEYGNKRRHFIIY